MRTISLENILLTISFKAFCGNCIKMRQCTEYTQQTYLKISNRIHSPIYNEGLNVLIMLCIQIEFMSEYLPAELVLSIVLNRN